MDFEKKLALYNLMIINNFQDIMSVVGCASRTFPGCRTDKSPIQVRDAHLWRLIAYEHQRFLKYFSLKNGNKAIS